MSFRWSEAREILERTPRVLSALLTGVSPAWVASRERRGSWNAAEVLGHLIQGECDDWVPRARRILEHGTRLPFEPFDRSAHLEWCRERSIAELLSEFTERRATSLRAMDELAVDDAQLQMVGTHPALGAVTLEHLLATWVVHDLNHTNQITRALAARYRANVGPWNRRESGRRTEPFAAARFRGTSAMMGIDRQKAVRQRSVDGCDRDRIARGPRRSAASTCAA